MNYQEFINTLDNTEPPTEMLPVLKALWYDGKNDWVASHDIAQDIHDNNGSLVHAYLHRKEGDISNARYWYTKAGRPECRSTLQQEWEALVREFLKD